MTAIFNLFYLYDPWFFHILRMGFVAGFFALLALIYKLSQNKQPNGVVIPIDSFVILICLLGFSAFPLFIHKTTDFSVIIMYCKALLVFILGIGVYNCFYNYTQGKQQFIRDLKIGIWIQASVGILALLGVPFLIDLGLYSHVQLPRFYGSEQEYRLYNITSAAFFQLSIFYVLLLHFLLAYNAKNNTISSVYLFLLLLIGTISGRTFLLLSIVSILLYFKWRYIPALFAFACLILGLAIFAKQNPYVAHALEPLINLFNQGELSSSSTDTLVEKHLFIPELKQLILGDGYYTTADGRYYGNTDSGFLRQILYGGVIYSLICLLFMTYFVKRVADNWFNGSWIFTLSTLFIFSVLNIKADTYAFPGIMLTLLMCLSLFGTQGKQVVLFKREGNLC